MSTKALRLCHLADVHLGYRRFNRLNKSGFNQRESDVNAAFREAVEKIIALRPDCVLIAGDLFHSVRPSNAVMTFAFREIRRLVTQLKAPVVIIAGNHETPRRADSGSPLRILAEIQGVFVADTKEERFAFPDLDLSVMCLPHATLQNAQTNLDLLTDDKYTHNVLLTHAQLAERWISDFGGATVRLSDLKCQIWDYVALGHIHVQTDVALNAAYSGSVEYSSHNFWNEASSNKGFLEIELPSGTRKFHQLTSPREVVVIAKLDVEGLALEDVNKAINDRIENIAGGLDGKLVRLEVINVTPEVRRQLDYREIRKWRAKALHLAIDFRAPERDPAQAFVRGSLQKLDQELKSFLKTWKFQQTTEEHCFATVQEYFKRLEVEVEASGG